MSAQHASPAGLRLRPWGNVYIRTRQPHFSPDRPTHLKAKVQAGASGLLSLSTLWEQRLSDRLGLSLSAGWLSASGKYRFRYRRLTPDGECAYDTTATRQNGDVRAERVELTLHGLLRQAFGPRKPTATTQDAASLGRS